jgi:hypothetical protein
MSILVPRGRRLDLDPGVVATCCPHSVGGWNMAAVELSARPTTAKSGRNSRAIVLVLFRLCTTLAPTAPAWLDSGSARKVNDAPGAGNAHADARAIAAVRPAVQSWRSCKEPLIQQPRIATAG